VIIGGEEKPADRRVLEMAQHDFSQFHRPGQIIRAETHAAELEDRIE